ncbi:MAG: carboxy terminal-processing peptidase [Cyclobacteriaceae bacterium]|nr:carboxy terminal-processing peptidase [Cyclobacteriaceae bacterium]
MKKLTSLLLVVCTFVFQSFSAQTDSLHHLEPEVKHTKEAMLIVQLLEMHHYRKLTLDDSLSSAILDSYIGALDPSKSYFTEKDIKEFEKYRFELDNETRKGNVNPAFDIFQVFQTRYFERMEYVKQNLITKEFNYGLEESQDMDREDDEWVRNEKELNDLWRKTVKNQKLSLKINGKTEEEIVKIIQGRYDRYSRTLEQYKSDDVFQTYMNALAESYDPHTNYFNKHTSDNFKINMSLSLEGIGATLQTDNDYTKVVRIVPGGPADKTGMLHSDDRIIAVGQGEEGEMEDVIGWRIDDVVSLIRGKKGTTVRLSVIPFEDGLHGEAKTLHIVRDKVKLEDQAAKKEIVSVTRNGKDLNVGVIKIPSFYMDWEDFQKGNPNYKSTTRDVKKLIEELEVDGVDGLVIDLRNNGGGSLAEAIELTGLFINKGPVVQVRPSDPRRQVEIGKDTISGAVYEGPLTILINRFSASASEIFAGAIQDYKRGVIVGEQTFGKGTVQSVIDLGRFIPEARGEVGQLKMTLQKFYRVTGSSTQHKGVTPDIELPSAFSAEEFGESSMKSALPWDQISSTQFEISNGVSDKLITKLNSDFNKRLKNDPDLMVLVEETNELFKTINTNEISLNEVKRQEERDRIEAKKKKNNKPDDTVVNAESGAEKADHFPVEDKYLREGLVILADMITARIG